MLTDAEVRAIAKRWERPELWPEEDWEKIAHAQAVIVTLATALLESRAGIRGVLQVFGDGRLWTWLNLDDQQRTCLQHLADAYMAGSDSQRLPHEEIG